MLSLLRIVVPNPRSGISRAGLSLSRAIVECWTALGLLDVVAEDGSWQYDVDFIVLFTGLVISSNDFPNTRFSITFPVSPESPFRVCNIVRKLSSTANLPSFRSLAPWVCIFFDECFNPKNPASVGGFVSSDAIIGA